MGPIRKKGVGRTNAKETVKLAAANGSPIHVQRDARLEFVRDGKHCNMKFLDADVKRTAGFRECDCRLGNLRRIRTAGIVHQEHEHWAEDSDAQEARRVCGAAGRTSGNEIDEHGEVWRAQHGFGFQAASVNQSAEEIRECSKTKKETKARQEACVTRIEKVEEEAG